MNTSANSGIYRADYHQHVFWQVIKVTWIYYSNTMTRTQYKIEFDTTTTDRLSYCDSKPVTTQRNSQAALT